MGKTPCCHNTTGIGFKNAERGCSHACTRKNIPSKGLNDKKERSQSLSIKIGDIHLLGFARCNGTHFRLPEKGQVRKYNTEDLRAL